VIVTGGSGLLGSKLVGRLRADHDVVVFDLQGDPTSPVDVGFMCTDLPPTTPSAGRCSG
jgi:nucleoside-diphosphate-sugar epimerase